MFVYRQIDRYMYVSVYVYMHIEFGTSYIVVKNPLLGE